MDEIREEKERGGEDEWGKGREDYVTREGKGGKGGENEMMNRERKEGSKEERIWRGKRGRKR